MLLDEHARAATPAPASAAAAASSRALVHPELDFDADVDEDAADPIFDDGGGGRGGAAEDREYEMFKSMMGAFEQERDAMSRKFAEVTRLLQQARDDIVFLAERNQELESAMAFGAAPLVRL